MCLPSQQQHKVMEISFTRPDLENEILAEQLNAFLTCCHELGQYALYLRSFPSKAAILAFQDADASACKNVLSEAELEWKVILHLESSDVTAQMLHETAPHVTFRCYREILGVCEKHSFQDHPEIREVCRSWFPPFSQSSNLEQVFREMEQAARRSSGFRDSLSGLTTVAAKGFLRRVCAAENTPTTVELQPEDWQGKTVRGLKPKMWSPSAATPCTWS